MKPITVLFPAVGGEPTIAATKALKAEWHHPEPLRLIGTDVDEMKQLLVALDCFHVSPRRDSDEYLTFLLRLCEEYEVDVVWPNPTEEQLCLEPFRGCFSSRGIKLLVPPGRAIRLFADKAKTYMHAASLGIRVPHWRYVRSWTDVCEVARKYGYPARPVVFRKTMGKGGIGLRVLRDGPQLAEDLFWKISDGKTLTLVGLGEVLRSAPRWPECIVTEYLPGAEYDVDCWCGEGENISVVRRNDTIWGGTSMVAEVVDRRDLVELSRRLVESVDWRYVCSVSFRDAEDGEPVLIEVNTRMPSSINLTWKAGCNMPLMALNQCLGRAVQQSEPVRLWS